MLCSMIHYLHHDMCFASWQVVYSHMFYSKTHALQHATCFAAWHMCCTMILALQHATCFAAWHMCCTMILALQHDTCLAAWCIFFFKLLLSVAGYQPSSIFVLLASEPQWKSWLSKHWMMHYEYKWNFISQCNQCLTVLQSTVLQCTVLQSTDKFMLSDAVWLNATWMNLRNRIKQWEMNMRS